MRCSGTLGQVLGMISLSLSLFHFFLTIDLNFLFCFIVLDRYSQFIEYFLERIDMFETPWLSHVFYFIGIFKDRHEKICEARKPDSRIFPLKLRIIPVFKQCKCIGKNAQLHIYLFQTQLKPHFPLGWVSCIFIFTYPTTHPRKVKIWLQLAEDESNMSIVGSKLEKDLIFW